MNSHPTPSLYEPAGSQPGLPQTVMQPSEQERQQQFVAELNALIQRYGFTIAARVQSETLGQVIQVRALPVIEPLANWQPTALQPNGHEARTVEKANYSHLNKDG